MSEQEIIVSNPNRALAFTRRDVVAIGFRHKRALLLSFFGVLLGVGLSMVFLPPQYRGETKVLITRERVDPVITAEQNVPIIFSEKVTDEDLNSEVELIRSDDVLRQVVAACGLDEHKSLLERLGFKLSPEKKRAKAVQQLQADLHVDPIKDTHLISITYSSRVPKLAERVLSTLNKFYVEKHLQVHRPTGRYAFFNEEVQRYEKQLVVAEAEMKQFTNENGGVAPLVARDLTLQKLTEFNGTLQTTRTAIAETKNRIDALKTQAGSTPSRLTTQVRKTDDAQVLQQLQGTLLTLELKRTELLTKYQPTYPLVQEVDKELADTRAALAKEESKPLSDVTTDQNPTYSWIDSELAKARAELSGYEARLKATQAVVNVLAASARRLDQQHIRYEDLARAQKVDEDNYLLYLKKREEARIADALDQTRILNVAIAQAPSVPVLPVRPPSVYGLLGVLLATVFSVGTVVMLDYMDQSFRTPLEVLTTLEIPVLASLPYAHAKALTNGNNGNGHVLWSSDDNGRRVNGNDTSVGKGV